MSFSPPPPPPPMPRILAAIIYVKDAQEACARGAKCWHETALRDAIRSARHFLDAAERALPQKREHDEPVANDRGPA